MTTDSLRWLRNQNYTHLAMTLFSVAIRCHTNDSGEKPHHHRAFHDPQ